MTTLCIVFIIFMIGSAHSITCGTNHIQTDQHAQYGDNTNGLVVTSGLPSTELTKEECMNLANNIYTGSGNGFRDWTPGYAAEKPYGCIGVREYKTEYYNGIAHQVPITAVMFNDDTNSLSNDVQCGEAIQSHLSGTTACIQRCSPCPLGKSGDGTSCSDNPPGYFTGSISTFTVGSISYDGTANSKAGQPLILCPAGYETDTLTQSGATSCDMCPLGKSNTGSTFACTNCPDGESTNNIDRECSPCDIGRYSKPSTGQMTCTPCGAGTYADDTGSDTCKDCPVGTYHAGLEKTMETDCQVCTAGHETNTGTSTGGTSCTSCDPGKYSDTGIECQNCEHGTYHTSGGLTSQNDCKTCGSGHYQPPNDPTACTPCTDGLYSTDSKIGCQYCPSGHKSNAFEGATTCHECPSGTYQWPTFSGQPNHLCQNCPTGKTHTLTAQVDESSCTACDPGFIVDGTNCIQCTGDTYADTSTNTCKSTMNPGVCADLLNDDDQKGQRYTSATSSQDAFCTPCPTGYSAPTSSGETTECSLCSGGYGGDGTDCHKCSATQYQEHGTHKNTPCADKACPAGYEVGSALGTDHISGDCNPCSKGTYTSSVATGQCQVCSGNYRTVDGSGQYVEQSAHTCAKCPAGQHGSVDQDGNSGDCVSCPDGHFNNRAGQSCRPCPAGRVPNTEKTNCKKCPRGSFSAAGDTTCTPWRTQDECDADEYYAQGTATQDACRKKQYFFDGVYNTKDQYDQRLAENNAATVDASSVSYKHCNDILNGDRIVVENNAKIISRDAFRNCKRLKRLNIGNTLELIEESAFRGSSLREVTIPANIVTIEKEAFKGAPLKKITVESITTTFADDAVDAGLTQFCGSPVGDRLPGVMSQSQQDSQPPCAKCESDKYAANRYGTACVAKTKKHRAILMSAGTDVSDTEWVDCPPGYVRDSPTSCSVDKIQLQKAWYKWGHYQNSLQQP